jgi:hypothetical protein
MASVLLLRGLGSRGDDRWTLEDRDEQLLAPVVRELVSFTVEPQRAAIVHERGGEIVAAWNEDGALRLAQALPPAYAALAAAIGARRGSGEPDHAHSPDPLPKPSAASSAS